MVSDSLILAPQILEHCLKTGHFPALLQLSTPKYLAVRSIILSDIYDLLLTAAAPPCLCAVGRRVARVNTAVEPTGTDNQYFCFANRASQYIYLIN